MWSACVIENRFPPFPFIIAWSGGISLFFIYIRFSRLVLLISFWSSKVINFFICFSIKRSQRTWGERWREKPHHLENAECIMNSIKKSFFFSFAFFKTRYRFTNRSIFYIFFKHNLFRVSHRSYLMVRRSVSDIFLFIFIIEHKIRSRFSQCFAHFKSKERERDSVVWQR